MGNLDLELESVEANEFELLPKGEYKAIIAASEIKTTNAGTGTYVKAEWLIVSGEYEGRKIWEMYTITNPNPKAVNIGKAQLKSIAMAQGMPANGTVKNHEDLQDKPVMIRVKTEPGQGEYGPKNRISGYMPIAKKPVGETTLENDTLPWTQA